VLYFAADDGSHGKEIWRSDGAIAVLITDLNPGGSANPQSLANAGGNLFFAADNGTQGSQLWVL
jgi:ELWxxDGT repeat protein